MYYSFHKHLLNLVTGIILITCITPHLTSAKEFCDDQYKIDEILPNHSRWEMCWEHREREGIVLHHVFYTPVNGSRRMIFLQANLAQIHVPYDDNGARFHDISDYGIGGGHMLNISQNDCRNGTLHSFENKNILCEQIVKRGEIFRDGEESRPGDALNLYSISVVGEYNYIPQWQFFDDGSIEPAVGATGALQRFLDGSGVQHGWLIADNKVGLAHTHNFFWRLDFDLNETANDDYVEEINFIETNKKLKRTITPLPTESSRRVDPLQLRSWRIVDGKAKNKQGRPISYEIQLNHSEHQDIGPDSEPFTHYDIYFTKQKSCEQFASNNTRAYGCADNVAEFANGESLINQDIVVWPSSTFYHMPRSEDAPLMDAHWSSLRIVPLDWHDDTPTK